MNIAELKELLNRAGINEFVYSLTGSSSGDQYVLSSEPGSRWVVFYDERGMRSKLREFSSEDAACRYLLEKLLNDPTTRKTAKKIDF